MCTPVSSLQTLPPSLDPSILPSPSHSLSTSHFSFLSFFPPSFYILPLITILLPFLSHVSFPLTLSFLPRLLSLLPLCHLVLIILTPILTFSCPHFPPPFLSLDAFPLPTLSYLPSSSTPVLSLTDLLTLSLNTFSSHPAFLLPFLPHSVTHSMHSS